MQKTVFIIDDDENDVLITKRALLKIDPEITVETALSGEAGLAFLRYESELPALVLLDLKMQGLSGFNVIHLVRSDERLMHLTIIVVSNSMLEADKVESIRSGANGFLHKNFDIDCFERDMKALLEHYLGTP